MKKKIKDLTLEELYKMCINYKCAKCPFADYDECPRFDNKLKDDLEKEVEADE